MNSEHLSQLFGNSEKWKSQPYPGFEALWNGYAKTMAVPSHLYPCPRLLRLGTLGNQRRNIARSAASGLFYLWE
jgi:hypothetical protein